MKTVIIEDVDIYKALVDDHEVLNKYSYVGVGAKYWNALTERWAKIKGNTSSESVLLEDQMKAIIQNITSGDPIKGVNVIDLGCGSGQPALSVLRALGRSNVAVSYTALDISEEMIEIALTKVSQSIDNLVINSERIDFETVDLGSVVSEISKNGYLNLLLLLGNTLGNYSKPEVILHNCIPAMGESGYIVLGVAMYQDGDKSELINSYNVEEEVKLLTSTAKRLGIDISDVEVEWNEQYKEIEVWTSVPRDLILKCDQQTQVINEGTRLLILRSKRHTIEYLNQLLEKTGMQSVLIEVNTDETNILALAKSNSASFRA